MVLASFALCWSAIAAATGPALLTQAEAELAALKYAKAAATLVQLEGARGLDHAQVVRALALSARVSAALGRAGEARAAFERLLEVEPGYTLEGRAAPKITGPYFEAKAAAKPLTIKVSPEAAKREWVKVKIALSGPLARLTSVRVRLTEDGVAREKSSRPVPELELAVKAGSLKVVVQLEDARAWVLAEAVQTFDAPVVLEALPPPLVLEPSSTLAPPSIVLVQQPLEPAAPRFRPLSYVLLGTGLASAAVGTGLYVKALTSSAELQRAVDGAMNGVLPVTHERAVTLNGEVRDFSRGGVIGWGIGAALVVAAIIFLVVGST